MTPDATIVGMAWEWVGPLVTGTIGTVTISVTVWLARKTSWLQNERSLKAERRALYGRFLGATYEMEQSGLRLGLADADDWPDAGEPVKEYRSARAKAAALLMEISIVAPGSVAETANGFLDDLMRAEFGAKRSTVAPSKARLLEEMRQDIA